MNTSSEALLTLINAILDFTKIDTGRVELQIVGFNLREFMESALKHRASEAEEKGLAFLCKVGADVPEIVRGDSGLLRQVVDNLVGNAVKFTDRGEVAVSVLVERQEGRDPLLHFVVSESGIGIPEGKRESIFAPFNQADTSTTRKYRGTGLGLTISTRLVAMMGGSMWVHSDVGLGTDFHFTIPMKSANEKESKDR